MQSAPTFNASRGNHGRVVAAPSSRSRRPAPSSREHHLLAIPASASVSSSSVPWDSGHPNRNHNHNRHRRHHNRTRGGNRRRGGGGAVELMPLHAEPSFYHPPSLQQPASQNDHHTNASNNNDFEQRPHQVPPALLSFPLMVSNEVLNINPAQDLALPLLSHGCLCTQCVRSQEIGFIEQCGEFQEIVGPGFYCLAWPFSTISGRLSLRIQQIDITCRTNTADKVFGRVKITVLFKVAVTRAYEAFYGLNSPTDMIQAVVLDVVRSKVPSISLDDLFASKSKVTDAVFEMLYQVMIEYGYEITSVLMTDIVPNENVRAAMNEINVSKRLKLAAAHKGEAHRTEVVKKAEANAERLYLAGVGTARERNAIVHGMQETVDSWIDDVYLVAPTRKDVMELLVMTQYLDMLTAVKPNAVIIRPEPTEVMRIRDCLPTTRAG